MIALIALVLSAQAGKDPCAERSEEEQVAFAGTLEGMHTQLTDSQTQEGAEDLTDKLAKEVMGFIKKGELCTLEQRFWGALILVSSTKEKYVVEGHDMAVYILEERHPRGAWLMGLAHDRKSVARGAVQAYGTQTRVENGKRCLIWTDLGYSDDLRKQYGYPTLEKTVANILAINGFQGVQPTVLELKKRDLWCKPEPWDGSRSDLRDPYDGRQ